MSGGVDRNRRKLEAFFTRCIEATATNTKEALPLLLEAPDYVERYASSLGPAYPDMRVRSLGILAFGLGRYGSDTLASDVFCLARSVGESSATEQAGLDVRQALLEAERTRWDRALELVNRAIVVFEGSDPCRDDCSLAFSLATRGYVHVWGFQNGAARCDVNVSVSDFHKCLKLADETMSMTRRAAVAGISSVSVVLWMTGLPTPRNASPIAIVEAMCAFRQKLRDEGTPWRSLTGAKARWILALALYRLFGHLGDYAERLITSAREILTEVGTTQDVREITLDYQWCLLGDGRFAAALRECDVLEAHGESPGVISGMTLLWRDALAKRRITPKITKQVYAALRGIPGVLSPLPPEDKAPWCRVGIVGRRLNDSDPIGF